MIKNLIFDFGGVILKHKFTIVEDLITEIFSDSTDKAIEIWKKYKLSLNTNKISFEDFITEVNEATNSNFTTQELRRKWKELYQSKAKNIDLELLSLVKTLKIKYKIILFTDTMAIHDEYNRTTGIYDNFDFVYKSFAEGFAKVGGKEAYRDLLRKIQAKPEECLFIDDLEKNVKIAKETGIKGIVYIGNQELKEDLQRSGVTV